MMPLTEKQRQRVQLGALNNDVWAVAQKWEPRMLAAAAELERIAEENGGDMADTALPALFALHTVLGQLALRRVQAADLEADGGKDVT